MRLEVLLATMDQCDDSVLNEMNVRSDIIVCNQTTEKMDGCEYSRADDRVRWYNFQERGVGLNRNNGLIRASGDICLLADDDIVYTDDYEKVVLDAFKQYQFADVILFNIYDTDGTKRDSTGKIKKIHLHNCGKYGAVRIAFRRQSVLKNAISFNQLFGGGCLFSAGEDTMFIRDCLRKGLKVIAVPDCILTLRDARPSTWFEGYTDKFFEDFGASYYCHYGNLAPMVTLLQLARRRKKWLKERTIWQAWQLARRGIAKFILLR